MEPLIVLIVFALFVSLLSITGSPVAVFESGKFNAGGFPATASMLGKFNAGGFPAAASILGKFHTVGFPVVAPKLGEYRSANAVCINNIQSNTPTEMGTTSLITLFRFIFWLHLTGHILIQYVESLIVYNQSLVTMPIAVDFRL